MTLAMHIIVILCKQACISQRSLMVAWMVNLRNCGIALVEKWDTKIWYSSNKLVRVKFVQWRDNEMDISTISPSFTVKCQPC